MKERYQVTLMLSFW